MAISARTAWPHERSSCKWRQACCVVWRWSRRAGAPRTYSRLSLHNINRTAGRSAACGALDPRRHADDDAVPHRAARSYVSPSVQRGRGSASRRDPVADAVSAAYGIPSARIRLVPLGVATRFRQVRPDDVEAVRKRYGLDFPYVLFVGAEPPRKNLGRLVEAFARSSRPIAICTSCS
jgi:glycosyltransferase involved in cell wall biosynthesis